MAYIVDPSLINVEDLKDLKPGKLIRLRRPAWGKNYNYTQIFRTAITPSGHCTIPPIINVVPRKQLTWKPEIKEDKIKFKLTSEVKTLSNEVRKKPY
jgi:hypothetical protein